MAILPLVQFFSILCALKQPSLPHIILRICFHHYQTIVQLFHHSPLLFDKDVNIWSLRLLQRGFQEACHPPFSECGLCDTLHGAKQHTLAQKQQEAMSKTTTTMWTTVMCREGLVLIETQIWGHPYFWEPLKSTTPKWRRPKCRNRTAMSMGMELMKYIE